MSETLRTYLAGADMDETTTLNLLQEHGIISDNCVTVADVGNGGKAVAWLETHKQHKDP
jgi:hypothetical protein